MNLTYHKSLLLFLAIFSLVSCASNIPKDKTTYMNQFEAFKAKEKFIEDSTTFYPGIADETMRPALTKKINAAADDFMQLSQEVNTSDTDYQEAIKKGLERFVEDYVNLDTEDRERICLYFEELMDIVGLESSGGHLNKFMYGFDPNE